MTLTNNYNTKYDMLAHYTYCVQYRHTYRQKYTHTTLYTRVQKTKSLTNSNENANVKHVFIKRPF